MNYVVQEILDLKPDISPSERDLITRAFLVSQKAHETQKRNNNDPYFNHVFNVAYILAQMNADPITISAGLLHDALEDTGMSSDEMRETFGDESISLHFNFLSLHPRGGRGEEVVNCEIHQ